MDDLIIRTASPEDAGEILDIYRYYVTDTAVTFELEPPDEAEFRRRIENTIKRYPYLAAVSGGRLVGYACAGPFVGRAAYRYCAEMTVYVDRDLRRSGVGGELYRKLEAALGKMGILSLYACIGRPETEDEYLSLDSVRFHTRMGYRTVGEFIKCGRKFGRWYDMVWMEKVIGNRDADPGEPVSFCELSPAVLAEIGVIK